MSFERVMGIFKSIRLSFRTSMAGLFSPFQDYDTRPRTWECLRGWECEELEEGGKHWGKG